MSTKTPLAILSENPQLKALWDQMMEIIGAADQKLEEIREQTRQLARDVDKRKHVIWEQIETLLKDKMPKEYNRADWGLMYDDGVVYAVHRRDAEQEEKRDDATEFVRKLMAGEIDGAVVSVARVSPDGKAEPVDLEQLKDALRNAGPPKPVVH